MQKERRLRQYADQIRTMLNNIGRESRAYQRPAIVAFENGKLLYKKRCKEQHGTCDFCGLRRILSVEMVNVENGEKYYIGRLCYNKYLEIKKVMDEMEDVRTNGIRGEYQVDDEVYYDDDEDDSFIVPDDLYSTDEDDSYETKSISSYENEEEYSI